MPLLEVALRGGAVTLLLLLAARRLLPGRTATRLYAGLFDLSAAAFVVESASPLAQLHAAWLIPLRVAATGAPALLWLVATACFDDSGRPARRRELAWLGLLALGALALAARTAALWALVDAVALLFLGLTVAAALNGHAADLLEGRRRFRVALVVAIALFGAGIIVKGRLPHGGPATATALSLVIAGGLLALAAVVAWIELGPAPVPAPVPAPLPATGQPPRPPPEPEPPGEAALAARVLAVMTDEKLYREEGFGIARLAARLDVPEYRVRRAINGQLGHRNFTSFVNGYRLADVTAALADPGQAAVPILTIALDAGFQSVGPFNRAFKAHAGMTPTDYRRQTLGLLADSGIGQPGSERGASIAGT